MGHELSPTPPNTDDLTESGHLDAINGLQDYLDVNRETFRARQIPVIQDIIQAMEEHGPNLAGYISAPTGIGKGYLIHTLSRALDERSTLIAVPTRALVSQFEQLFSELSHSKDLGRIDSESKQFDARIRVITYNSLIRHANDENSRLNPQDVDLLILDEAHRALGKETTKALEAFPRAMKIGFTATDEYSDKKGVKNILPHEIHKIDIKEAVEADLVRPFSVWAVMTGTNISHVRITKTKDYDTKELEKAINNKRRNNIAADLYVKYFGNQKVIFSCAGVEHVQAMTEALKQKGVAAGGIHGYLGALEQREIIKKFRAGEVMVLVNDKVLAEGFDDPEVNAVFNVSPTLSVVRSQQRSGRALRIDPKNPNKYPVIVEFLDDNYQQAPVIFSDSRIAGAARLGDWRALHQNVEVEGATVLTNPEDVERISEQLVEQSTPPKKEYAPEGWLPIVSLAREMGVPGSVIKNALAEIDPEDIQDSMGQFWSKGSPRKGTFYSPRVKSLLERYIDMPDVAPKGWLSKSQLSARYDVSINHIGKAVNSAIRQLGYSENHSGKFAKLPNDARTKEFFSPECVQYMAEYLGCSYIGDAVPDNWASREQIIENFGTHASAEALDALWQRSKEFLSDNSIITDAGVFFGPKVLQKIEALVAPPTSWHTVDEIIKYRKVPQEAADWAAKKLSRRLNLGRVCFVDGKEQFYLPYSDVVGALISEAIEEYKYGLPESKAVESPATPHQSVYLGALASSQRVLKRKS